MWPDSRRWKKCASGKYFLRGHVWRASLHGEELSSVAGQVELRPVFVSFSGLLSQFFCVTAHAIMQKTCRFQL